MSKIKDYFRSVKANEYTRKGFVGMASFAVLETSLAIMNYLGFEVDRPCIIPVFEATLFTLSGFSLAATSFGESTYSSLLNYRKKFDGRKHLPLDSVYRYFTTMVYCHKKGFELAAEERGFVINQEQTLEALAAMINEDPSSFGRLPIGEQEGIIQAFHRDPLKDELYRRMFGHEDLNIIDLTPN